VILVFVVIIRKRQVAALLEAEARSSAREETAAGFGSLPPPEG